MAEYIEREALLANFGEEPEVWYDEDHEIQARNDWHMYKNMVEAQPVADVVKVVRCKDCVIAEPSVFGDNWRFCINNDQHHQEDHFCGYGTKSRFMEDE